MTTSNALDPSLVASTSPLVFPPTKLTTSFSVPTTFRRTLLSPDGTTLLTHTSDHCLRSFILPPSLLSSQSHLSLESYSISSGAHSHAQAFPPYFSLLDSSTTHVLHSRKDLPIRLTNALDLSYTHASYPLVHGPTESYVCPHSLTFAPDGTKFVAGSNRLVSIFDLSRDGERPVAGFQTGQRKRRAGSGLSGLVTALAICAETGVLAAGSTDGEVALYEAGGVGEEILSFGSERTERRRGKGVMQVEWDRLGRYLFTGQRGSDAIAVFDIRRGERKCWLKGRKAETMMRMAFDIVERDEGVDVWAGGIDGSVRVWKDVTNKEGAVEAEIEWEAHGDAVSSVLVHPSADVVITAAGSRGDGSSILDDDYEVKERSHDTPGSDVSLKIWAT
ncbi:WD domain-containing protein 33 [Elsinoe australis]|uniref:WD domain-containing protein 33 n=1 Tax=Elsinoe australis TaxID=40998 RepID=A0A4U7AP83_9PEZI|nr:WD domain-containing protein 33 [Elsinoe australis]